MPISCACILFLNWLNHISNQNIGNKFMRNKSLITTFLALFFSFNLFASVANLQPKDVNSKVNEFLFSHITQKKLSTEIIKRALDNYIEETDPMKMYYTYEEIKPYLEPTDETLDLILSNFYKSQFVTFENLHKVLANAIERNSKIEKKVNQIEFNEKVKAKEIEDMGWAQNEEELINKRVKVLAYYKQTAEKFDDDFKSKYIQLVNKRHKWREEELTGKNPEEFKKIVYSHILKAVASALDSQTTYFTPDEASIFMMQIQQKLLGIGVALTDDLTGFKIMEVIDGGPVDVQGGVQKDDLIVAVDDEIVVGMDINQAIQKIRGQEDTPVKLTLLRKEDGQDELNRVEATIIRGEIVINESRLEAKLEPYGDGHIAHVTLHSFYQDHQSSCAKDLYEKIAELKKDNNLKGVILDLRNNGGGLLVQAVAVDSLFLKKGIVASIKSHDGSVQHLRNAEPNIIWDGPMLILINKLSASSAEIVAQSLQDYGRALVIGDEHSFGKGTFQIPTMNPLKQDPVDPKGEYKVTQGMYYTVSGKSPQLVGVKSDIVIPGHLKEVKVGEEFSKYPVENNSISANFEDKLSDVPFFQREQVKKYYLNDLQPKLDTYTKHLDSLIKNSQARVEANKDYQHFLEAFKPDVEEETEFKISKIDLQLQEAQNVMKDLIYLTEKEQLKKEDAA